MSGNQLFLEIDGVRRNDDPAFAVLQRGEGGRDQVGETLSDAGTGLGHQMMFVPDRVGDGASHFELLRTALELGQLLGDASVRSQD